MSSARAASREDPPRPLDPLPPPARPLRFLVEAERHFDHQTATLVEGLRALGHEAYGLDGNWNSYLLPHAGEPVDWFIQATRSLRPHDHLPGILVVKDDSPPGSEHVHAYLSTMVPHFEHVFVRDLRADDLGPTVHPLNFGIEDRYYCVTGDGYPPLVDRRYNVVFLGSFRHVPARRMLVDAVAERFAARRLLLDDTICTTPDGYWSTWLNAHCTHSIAYFEALAEARIVLSPAGLGPDCARHWEAMASGGIPLIETLGTRMCPPGLVDRVDGRLFTSRESMLEVIGEILDDVGAHQALADAVFRRGLTMHRTRCRARYVVDRLTRPSPAAGGRARGVVRRLLGRR